MDAIRETPVKKRRLDAAGASQETQVVGDENEDQPETVATLPLPVPFGMRRTSPAAGERRGKAHAASSSQLAVEERHSPTHPRSTSLAAAEQFSSSSALQSYPLPPAMQPVTQPTQPIRIPTPEEDAPEVQVLASSPARLSPPPLRGLVHRPSPDRRAIPPAARPAPGRLASLMAPPGTSFRAPLQRAPARAEPIIIDSDDEAMPYVGGSSDEDHGRARDIKPTEPKLRQKNPKAPLAQTPQERFSSLASRFLHNPPQKGREEGTPTSRYFASNRSDSLAAAYGGQSRTPTKTPKDLPRPRTPPSTRITTLDDIHDYQMRRKVQRMQETLPGWSVEVLCNALFKKRGNADDAIEYLFNTDAEDDGFSLTSPVSEHDYLASSPTLVKQKSKERAKQTLKEPIKSIQERYTNVIASPDPAQKAPRRAERPRRRLIQGRRQRSPDPSSPAQDSSPIASPKSPSEEIVEIDDDGGSDEEHGSDSGIVTEPTGDLLSFFNTCTAPQLMDLASISESLATHILAQAPFRSLKLVRKIEDPNAAAGKRKRMTAGEKVVETAEEMWSGYQAVDQLVDECQRMSQPVRDEMAKWGVDVFGASSNGGLELVSWKHGDDKTPSRDSGIGTPTTVNHSGGEEEVGDRSRPKLRDSASSLRFFPQPKSMNEGVKLKEYQVVGVNWLDLLFRSRLSGILADDMGLGKTCQVIAFLARLKELGISGPHVVVVPASTIENWMREFKNFCSALKVFPYHGLQQERFTSLQPQIEASRPDVIVTTYTLARAKDDRKFLKGLRPIVCVFDEAHQLKNRQSMQYQQLMSIRCEFRLLLTGTPLQNNLQELVSLLGFLLPSVFDRHSDNLDSIFHHRAKTSGGNGGTTGDDNSHAALLSATRIAKAKAMLAPFVLRRKKDQVLRTLPPKTQQVRFCEMTETQAALYHSELARLKAALAAPKGTRKDQENVLMVLRKAAIHPWLFRRGYTDALLAKMAATFVKHHPDRELALVVEDLSLMTDAQLDHLITEDEYAAPILDQFRIPGEGWMDSGKVGALLELLTEYAANGDRALVFSQFTQVLDILERVFQEHNVKFVRLDGNTPVAERQPLLDMFTSSPEIPVFLLSTKAGGAGINLAAANRVVIFDSSFNPQDDVQAENRAHRVGQTRPVHVVRLVTAGTIEEQILELGRTKLALGSRVAGGDEEGEGTEAAPSAPAPPADGAAEERAGDHRGKPHAQHITETAKATSGTATPLDEGYDSAAPPSAREAEAKDQAGQRKVLDLLKVSLAAERR